MGSITDEEKREITINFDFLDASKEYEAIIYKDAEDAHWNNNPTSYKIEKMVITKDMERSFVLAEGGGFAITLKIKK